MLTLFFLFVVVLPLSTYIKKKCTRMTVLLPWRKYTHFKRVNVVVVRRPPTYVDCTSTTIGHVALLNIVITACAMPVN